MPDKRGRLARASLSEDERRLRSRLAQLVTSYGFVRGSLSLREKSCGRPNCRCARGEKHVALYLVAREDGKLHQLFVPSELEATVREWVGTQQEIRDLLEELSRRQWAKLQRREV